MNEYDTVAADDLSDLRARLGAAAEVSSLRPIGIREVVRGEGAIQSLTEILQRAEVADDSLVAVLSDATPKSYADRDVVEVVVETLSVNFRVTLEILAAHSPEQMVLADEETVSRAANQVRHRSPDVLVSVGSGTITDIAKVVAGELDVFHVVVQTAASVNGFADDQSVLLVNGAKRTTPSRWPDVLVVDPFVTAFAPVEMARSGLGDQLSMFTAAADWYLSDTVGFDTSYSPVLVAMMRDGVGSLLSSSAELGRGESQAINSLADFLTRGGIAMGVAGRTAPSSGLEHTISHLLEMHADANEERSAPHGSQVGVSSVVAAIVWQRILERLAQGGVTLLESNVATRERVLDAFTFLDTTGATAQECWRLYQRKASWIREHVDDLARVLDHWSSHEAEISKLLMPAADLVAALKSAGAPVTFRDLNPAPERAVIVWALANCHLLRDRFGILDLADLMGLWSANDVTAVLQELDEVTR